MKCLLCEGWIISRADVVCSDCKAKGLPHWLVPLSIEEDEALARTLAAHQCQDCDGVCLVCAQP